jgi:cytochrome b561
MIHEPEYSAAAKSLHWVTALLLVVQFPIGWIMPKIGPGMQPESLLNLHLSIGTLILVAALARVTWRLFHGVPAPEASLPAWQERMARALHTVLYVLLFAMIVTGWSYASMRGWTVTVFGLLALPASVAQDSGSGAPSATRTASWVGSCSGRLGCTWRRRLLTSCFGETVSCSA